ncbi:3-hydroxyacyl-CoA dehydrogenase family protein [Sphingomonas tagetis]|uniref:3-hydroxyacyl-CoA dehydrogenase family protein n=1 Tax=Sphingomonas tagetis TaxID=2949092 RepID=UPI00345F0996
MFIIEALKLVEEGVATPEHLDTACRLGLGHPIGPFALMDAVTSNLCVQAQEIMQESYSERFRPPPLLKQRVRAGYGGGKGKPTRPAPVGIPSRIRDTARRRRSAAHASTTLSATIADV